MFLTMELHPELERLVFSCLGQENRERPEIQWLKEKYDSFLIREGLRSKAAADALIYERMYGVPPTRAQDTLKIRYWRTGHHLPSNQKQCGSFGWALGLGGEDRRFLLQGYYDGCDEIYEEEPEDRDSPYWKRRAVLEELVEGYLARVPAERLGELNIVPEAVRHNIRHLYYTDALRCVSQSHAAAKGNLNRHISSITYDSELGRNLKLLGVIPRKTMIRHLILLGMPNMTLDWMNGKLEQLGYLPLRDWHTMRHGECLDRLLIQLFQLYGSACANRSAEERQHWFQQNCRILDAHLEKRGENRLRFMYFRSLGD